MNKLHLSLNAKVFENADAIANANVIANAE